MVPRCSRRPALLLPPVACRLDCPMFRVHPDIITNQSSLVFATLDAMQPNERFKGVLQQ